MIDINTDRHNNRPLSRTLNGLDKLADNELKKQFITDRQAEKQTCFKQIFV